MGYTFNYKKMKKIGTAIQLNSEEEVKAVCDFLYDNDEIMEDGRDYKYHNTSNGENLLVLSEGYWCDLSYAKRINYTILNFDDIILTEIVKDEIREYKRECVEVEWDEKGLLCIYNNSKNIAILRIGAETLSVKKANKFLRGFGFKVVKNKKEDKTLEQLKDEFISTPVNKEKYEANKNFIDFIEVLIEEQKNMKLKTKKFAELIGVDKKFLKKLIRVEVDVSYNNIFKIIDKLNYKLRSKEM